MNKEIEAEFLKLQESLRKTNNCMISYSFGMIAGYCNRIEDFFLNRNPEDNFKRAELDKIQDYADKLLKEIRELKTRVSEVQEVMDSETFF